MCAAEKGRADVIPLLKKEVGLRLECEGWTALMFAAQNGHVECVSQLLEEADMQDVDALYALDYAKQHGHSDCVKVLK